MAFVYKILFFLATSFLLMSKSSGAKWIDQSRSASASASTSSNEAAARAAAAASKASRTVAASSKKDQLSADQAASASRRDADLWQSFEVAATDPELTDPLNVKPSE